MGREDQKAGSLLVIVIVVLFCLCFCLLLFLFFSLLIKLLANVK